MASRKTLENALNNANVRQFLDLLAYTEGTQKNGYRTAFGGGKLSSLADHPRYLKSFKQTNGKTNQTSAAGRYQFLRGTWDGLARRYGFKDFGAKNQDLGAVALLAQNGALPHILKGDWGNAVAKAGGTWASLPSSPHPQPTKSWKKVQDFMGGYQGQDKQRHERINKRGNWSDLVAQQRVADRKKQGSWNDLVMSQRVSKRGNWSDLVAQHEQKAVPQSTPNEAPAKQGFGTFGSITAELPKLKDQGLNPYQAIYQLAQRDDDIGASIKQAYQKGLNTEQLTNYFGVGDIWQTQNKPLNNTLPMADDKANLTAQSLPKWQEMKAR